MQPSSDQQQLGTTPQDVLTVSTLATLPINSAEMSSLPDSPEWVQTFLTLAMDLKSCVPWYSLLAAWVAFECHHNFEAGEVLFSPFP
jgi:hypothetical protein